MHRHTAVSIYYLQLSWVLTIQFHKQWISSIRTQDVSLYLGFLAYVVTRNEQENECGAAQFSYGSYFTDLAQVMLLWPVGTKIFRAGPMLLILYSYIIKAAYALNRKGRIKIECVTSFRRSNTGEGDNFRIRPDRPWGPSSLLYSGYRGYFPGVKRTGRGADQPPHLALRLKKE